MQVIEREAMMLGATVKQRERNGTKDKIRMTGQGVICYLNSRLKQVKSNVHITLSPISTPVEKIDK